MSSPPTPQLDWADIAAGAAERWHDTEVEIAGWMAPVDADAAPGYFLLTPEPVCCRSCLPADPRAAVEVVAAAPVPLRSCPVRLRGRWWRLADDDAAGWRWQLHAARVVAVLPRPDEGGVLSRRMVLAAAPLLYPAMAAAQGPAGLPTRDEPDPARHLDAARQLLARTVSVDMHSHAGSILGMQRVANRSPFAPVAQPMREGGMALICLAMVADTPVTRILPEKRMIVPGRAPQPGELYTWAQRAFERVMDLVRAQALNVVTNAATLAAARRRGPAVVIAAEGADFLEGRIERLEEACRTWQLRHLQLTHYRVNELGDIQTEAPQHGGLTGFGAEVVRACNRLGIVVDVAHGPLDLVKRAAAATSRPLVLSHTSLGARPGPRSRLVSPEHARIVAQTGGVIGIWPPTTIFVDMKAYVRGIARMVDAVGIYHVGIGSDMRGLLSPSAFDDYRQLPELAASLLAAGFRPDDAAKILGGNYVRVFTATTG